MVEGGGVVVLGLRLRWLRVMVEGVGVVVSGLRLRWVDYWGGG